MRRANHYVIPHSDQGHIYLLSMNIIGQGHMGIRSRTHGHRVKDTWASGQGHGYIGYESMSRLKTGHTSMVKVRIKLAVDRYQNNISDT